MRLLLVFFLFASISGPGWSQSGNDRTPPPVPHEAVFGPIPDFVDELPMMDPDEVRFDAYGGVRYLLIDDQHDARTSEPVYYRRRALQVENVTGITEAATLESVFNPAYQTLIFHHIQVIRDGEVVDMRDRSAIEFARRETDQARQMFNGEVTAIIRVDDVRVRDIVDVAYSIIGINETYSGLDFRHFALNYSVPIETMRVRSLWNERDVRFWDVWGGDEGEIEELHSGGTVEFRLPAQGRAALDAERGAPAWTNQFPMLRISRYGDWDAVERWAAPLFDVPPSPAVTAVLRRIEAEYDTPEERLIGALRFVQDEIRYLAITYGQGSHIPAPPSETLETRYGDCKAKSVLFAEIARALGFDADIVLANLLSGHGLDDYAPMPGVFDHVIVRIRRGGAVYWIDPTNSQQGGTLATIAQPDYGWALPLDGRYDGLVSMHRPIDRRSPPSSVVTERIDLSAGPTEPITMEVESVYTGADADSMRLQTTTAGRSGVERNYLDFYNRNFGEAEFDERIRIEDDRDANRLVIRESVWLGSPYEAAADGRTANFSFFAHMMNAVVDSASQRRRDTPLYVMAPAHARHIVEIQLTNGGVGWEIDDADETIENAAFHYRTSETLRNGIYRLEFERTALAHQVAPQHALEVLREHEDMMNSLYYGLEIDTAPPPAAAQRVK